MVRLPVIRLQPPEDVAFYDYEAKYQRNDVEYGIPCGLSESEEKELQALAYVLPGGGCKWLGPY